MISQKIIDEGKLKLNVDAKVVSHLSIGLYKNLSRAIKELVSNAYDAEAKEVKINLDLKSKKLVLKDNGKGMGKEEIQDNLLTIGKITPRSKAKAGLGRKRIGQFGVGFLAVFPYCETIKVISKKRDDENVIEVTVKAKKYFKSDSWLLTDSVADIDYKIRLSLLPKEQGETIIVMEDIREHVLKDLANKEKEGYSSIEKYGGFERTKWELSQYLPLQFPKEYENLREFFEVKGRVPLRVWFDGEELFRNVPEGANNKRSKIIEKGEERFGNVHIKYVILSPFTSINPREARGFQLRLNDVGIGLLTDFDVIKLKRVLGKLHYLSGEIHIIDGLDNDLQLNRDEFYYTKNVSEMYEFFRNKLTKWERNLQSNAMLDKDLYEAISSLPNEDKIINDFKTAGIIKFDKTSLRIPKAPIIKKGKGEISTISKRINEIASKKGFDIEKKKCVKNKKGSSIEVDIEKKKIFLYEDHPSLSEKVSVSGKTFLIKLDEWKISEEIDSICKIDLTRKLATFNKNHPIFNIKLDNKIIMRFFIGLKKISIEGNLKSSITAKIYKLFKELFS